MAALTSDQDIPAAGSGRTLRSVVCGVCLAVLSAFGAPPDVHAETRPHGSATGVVGPAFNAARASPAHSQCRFKRRRPGVVTKVVSSTTLRLDDGALIKLQSLLSPQATDVPGARGDWPLQQEVRLALERRLTGRNIRYAARRGRPDRYNRRLAHVWTEEETASAANVSKPAPENLWVQDWMLRQGLARFAPDRERTACADRLARAEREAERARRGLWALNAYRIREATELRELRRLRNTFQIVEGSIVNAGQSRGGRIYLNFGRNWRRDFTGGISRRQMRFFSRSPVSPMSLAGARVRIRGWIEYRGGPYIEIEHTHQLEVLSTKREGL